MNNIVSFETAKRLKEAGFPQPEPEFGQFWYNGSDLLVVVKYLGAKEWIACPLSGANWTRLFSAAFQRPIVFGEPVFAPSATDILRELGPGFVLYFDSPGRWVLSENNPYGLCTNHENPAEASAEAWLKLNEK